MKAKYIMAIALLAVTKLYAQEPADALRYSWLTQNGTARNQAIGGAGASLGGEFTSLFINPAGLGFYKTNEFILTPAYSLKNANSTYLNTSEKDNNNNFNIGASGLLFSSPSQKGKGGFAFAIGVNKIADFSNHIYYKGQNSNSSYSEKYLEELIDNNITDPNSAASDFPYGSSLAFNTYLIDTTNDASGTVNGYRSQANPAFGLTQENTINTSGGITDFAIGTGFSIKDKFYFGGTLSFPFLNYTRDSYYKEADASGDPNNNFNYFEADETLNTKGVGVNGKLGIIYKPAEDIRLGLAFHTPTAYALTDRYNAQVTTDLEGYAGSGTKTQSSTDVNGDVLVSKYTIVTPLKVIASASYVLHEVADVKAQRGFVTADVEYVNYKGAKFKPEDKSDQDASSYYSSLTDVVSNIYKNAVNVRLGGELKFDTYMVRLGGAYYGNPYKNETASLYKVSGGVGYRNKGIFVDLTYVYTLNKDVNYPYMLEDKPNTPALIKNSGSNIIATIGFKM